MKKELIAGGIGTTLSAVGTATQLNEVLQTISLIVTIIGAIVSFVVVPLLSWYKNAKKDGKITIDEWNDAADELNKGLDKAKREIEKDKERRN